MAPADAATPDWATVEDEAVSNMVYLVTFSALTQHGDAGPEHVLHGAAGAGELRDPDSLTREQVRDAVLDAVANPCSCTPAQFRAQLVFARTQLSSQVFRLALCVQGVSP